MGIKPEELRAKAKKQEDQSDSDSESSSGSSGSSSGSESSSSSSEDSPSPQRSRARGGRERSPVRAKRRTSAGDAHRSRSPHRSGIRREHRSPTPKPTKLHIGNLTKNINKDHITEIFSFYGKVKSVDLPTERNGFPKGLAYVEYEDHAEAEKALKYMNGGQIDGQLVSIRAVLPIRRRAPRRSPPPMMGRGGPRGYPPPPPPMWRRSPPRRRRPPPPRSPLRRRRSPSPPPRRRRARSRSSSSDAS